MRLGIALDRRGAERWRGCSLAARALWSGEYRTAPRLPV